MSIEKSKLPDLSKLFETRGSAEKIHKTKEILEQKTHLLAPIISYQDLALTQRYLLDAKIKLEKKSNISLDFLLNPKKIKLSKKTIQFFNRINTLVGHLGKGSQLSGAKMMDYNYFKESRPFTFKFNDGTISGQFHPSCTFIEKYFDKWVELKDTTNKSFEAYVNDDIIPNLSKEAQTEAIKDLQANSIQYFSKEERETFEVVVKNNTLYYQNPYPAAWSANDNSETTSYKDFLKTQSSSDMSKTLTPLSDGQYAVVLDNNAQLLMIKKKKGSIQHSSLTGAEAVLGAGMIKVKNGKLTHFSNTSGHYKPELLHFLIIADALQKKGIDLSHVKGEVRYKNKSLLIDALDKFVQFENEQLITQLKILSDKINIQHANKLPYHRLLHLFENVLKAQYQAEKR